MRQFKISFIAAGIIFFNLIVVGTAFATSGACSGHGGVDCSAGADYDGSVICSDGWTGSSVSYYSMVECSSYGSPSYTTPSCPLMSSYNYLSGTCQCVSGYVVGKDYLGNQSCVSADSVCHQQLGIMSSYNSLNKTCECDYGYLLYNGQCTSQTNRCTELFGYGAQYNSSKDQCECRTGYSFNGSVCVLVLNTPSYSLPSNLATPSTSCVENSALRADGQCYCNDGYQPNSDKSACVVIESTSFSSISPTPPMQGAFDPAKKDSALIAKLRGQILLQVQARGEAWYINPSDSTRYYMPDGSAAYNMMRSFGLGIVDSDIGKIPAVSTTQDMQTVSSACSSNSFANKLKGKILLQVQSHGEAWYIDPRKCRRIYMKDGDAAYQIMRYLGLGIADADLEKIPTIKTQ